MQKNCNNFLITVWFFFVQKNTLCHFEVKMQKWNMNTKFAFYIHLKYTLLYNQVYIIY